MVLKLIPDSHPLLHRKIEKCNVNLNRPLMHKILKENLEHYEGVGLAANQIGINERVFVMVSNLETKETITCFNPKIIKESEETIEYDEGCLSYPDTFREVTRPKSIEVSYEDVKENLHKIELTGFICRIFQHEYDHMEGIVFIER